MKNIKKVYCKKVAEWNDKKTGWKQNALVVLVKFDDDSFKEVFIYNNELKELLENRVEK